MIDLDHLKELLAKATPGPWEQVLEIAPDLGRYSHSIYGEGYKGLLIGRVSQNGAHPDDAALIAAAVNALPSLISALEAEREKVAKLREAVRPMAEVSTDVPEEYPDNYQVVTSCGHFRTAARAYKETSDE